MAGNITNTDILQSINQVVKAINDLSVSSTPSGNTTSGGSLSRGGCGGCGGFSIEKPGGGILDDDPVPDLGNPESDPPPDGFDTWEDYNAYKCQAANFLFDATLMTLRLFGTAGSVTSGITAGAAFGSWLLVQIGAWLATGLVAVEAGIQTLTLELALAMIGSFLAAATGWEIALIVAAIAAVTATVGVGVMVVFDWMGDDFEGKREQVVCDLYKSQGVAEAQDILATAYTDSTASFVISAPYNAFEATVRSLLASVGAYFFPNSFVNQLFSPSDIVSKYDGGLIDCAVCEACSDIYVANEFGFVDSGSWDDCDVTIVSQNAFPIPGRVDISFWTDNGQTDRVERTVTVLEPTPDPLSKYSSSIIYRFYNASLSLVHNSDSPPSLPISNIAAISIVANNTGFLMHFVVQD